MLRAILITCLVSVAAVLPAQQPVQVCDLATGQPLEGAQVHISASAENSRQAYRSNAGGVVTINIENLQILQVYMPGYADWEGMVTSSSDTFRVRLQPLDSRLDPVVVTALTAPAAGSRSANNIRVIGRPQMEQLAAQNLSELLANEVNFNLGQDAVMGTSAIMQGISGQNIKVLMNGVPVLGRLNGNIDVSQINLSNVERVEIIEGPMSAVYGTDALGGVINIITRNAGKRGTNADAHVYADGLRNYNTDLTVQHRVNRKLALSLNGGRYFFGGIDFNPQDRPFDWKPKLRQFAEGNLFLKTGAWSHRFQTQIFRERLNDRQAAEYSNTGITGYNHIYHTNRYGIQWQANVPLKRQVKLEFLQSWQLFGRDKEVIRRNLVDGTERDLTAFLGDQSLFSHWMFRGFAAQSRPWAKIQWMAGYEANFEQGTGDNIPQNSPGISDVALFGVADYKPVKRLLLRPGLRLIYNNRFGSSLGNEGILSKVKLAPVIPSLQWKWDLSSHMLFRGAVAAGYRAPGLKELNLLFVDNQHNVRGNEQLKAEQSINYNIGLDYRRPLLRKQAFRFDYAIFQNQIRNRITLALVDPLTNLYTYINVGSFQTQGMSMNAGFMHPRYSMNAGWSTIGIRDDLDGSGLKGDRYFYFTQFRLNLGWTPARSGWSVNLFQKYSGKTRGYNADRTTYTIQDFWISDVVLSKQLLQQQLRISFGCRNALGITSIQSNRISGGIHAVNNGQQLVSPGRQFFIRLTWQVQGK